MNRQRIFHQAPQSQKGIAIITAILIAALVASLAFALSGRERQWLNLLNNRNDYASAQAIALSSIDMARLTLRDDMKNNQVDHLLEVWTIPVPPINVEEGKVGGKITELQGRFNLYNLQSAGTISATGLAAMQRLLANQELPMSWAEKLAAAMANRVLTWQQTQKTDTSTAKITSKLLPVSSLYELAQLAGVDADKIAILEPWVVVLPEATAVNVNFAPPEVLMAITPNLSLGEAEQMANLRAKNYFNSAQQFVNKLPEAARLTAKSATYTVESQYFQSDTEAWFGRAHVHLQALIYRQRNKMPDILTVKQR